MPKPCKSGSRIYSFLWRKPYTPLLSTVNQCFGRIQDWFMSCVLLTYSLDGKTLPVEVLLFRQFDVSEYFTMNIHCRTPRVLATTWIKMRFAFQNNGWDEEYFQVAMVFGRWPWRPRSNLPGNRSVQSANHYHGCFIGLWRLEGAMTWRYNHQTNGEHAFC